MIGYNNYNCNPKGRKTGDCSTRAIATTLNISWDDALKEQVKWSLKTHYDVTSKQVVEKVLEEWGWVKMKQPRKLNGKKYLVRELDQILTPEQLQEGVLVTIANHHTCIKDGMIQDIWNCGNKSVGNYYIRKAVK
jgi:hypothetical protein